MTTLRYSDIPDQWALCMQADCPMASRCLRYHAASVLPKHVRQHVMVLPSARTADGCKSFVADQPQQVAYGMSRITEGMNPWLARDVHADLFELFGSRATFYRKSYGSPIAPDMQERVAAVLRSHGVSAPPRFDRVEEAYYFPEG